MVALNLIIHLVKDFLQKLSPALARASLKWKENCTGVMKSRTPLISTFKGDGGISTVTQQLGYLSKCFKPT